MASMRRQRKRQCDGKKKYAKAEARAAAAIMNRKSPGTVPMDAYPCPFCSGGVWHVGHRPSSTQTKITARRRAKLQR